MKTDLEFGPRRQAAFLPQQPAQRYMSGTIALSMAPEDEFPGTRMLAGGKPVIPGLRLREGVQVHEPESELGEG